MFKKQKFSKIYLASFFLLLIIISIFAALIFEKTTKDNELLISITFINNYTLCALSKHYLIISNF